MQVYSVNSSNLKLNQSFGNGDFQEQFAQLSDRELRQIAYNKASHDVNDRRHRRLDNAIINSIPLAAGVAAAAAAKTNRIGKLAAFGLGTASWAIPFAIVDATFGLKHFVDKKIKAFGDFSKENPFLSLVGAVGASFLGFALFRKGANVVLDKYGAKIMAKSKPFVNKLSKALDSSKVLNKAEDVLKKVPSSLKEFSKTALDWAPWALFFTSIAHSISHDKARNAQFEHNYVTLKTAQQNIREDIRAAENEA